jgi:hypothetical protein
MSAEIALDGGRCAFAPGEAIAGTVAWEVGAVPGRAELRLFWRTAGKGTVDIGVVATQAFPEPGLAGRQPFRLVAPAHPPSCSGRLVSIQWALELVVDGAAPVLCDLVLGPDGREIRFDGG